MAPLACERGLRMPSSRFACILRQKAFGKAGKADGSGLVGLNMVEFRSHRPESMQGDQDDLMNAHVNLQFDART